MSTLIIHLIGAITLSCGNPTQAVPNPCAADQFPKKIEMLVPDARFNSKICKEGDTNDPTIEPHEAFIRIRGKQASTPGWPNAIACDDNPKPCVLYPIVKRRLTIDGVTSGSGTTITNPDDYPKIHWKYLFDGASMALPKIGNGHQLARMTIRNGTITYEPVDHIPNAIGATITVTKPAGPTMIHATSTSNVLELSVPEGAAIDIMNFPRSMALSDFNMPHNHDDDCDHFFLHYLLADNQPVAPCPFPQDGHCPPHGPSAGATIACSNSNYP